MTPAVFGYSTAPAAADFDQAVHSGGAKVLLSMGKILGLPLERLCASWVIYNNRRNGLEHDGLRLHASSTGELAEWSLDVAPAKADFDWAVHSGGAKVLLLSVGKVLGGVWHRGGMWVLKDRLRAMTFGGLSSVWMPKDCLRAMTFGGQVLTWLSIIGSRFFCLFLNGLGISVAVQLRGFSAERATSVSTKVTTANIACRNLVATAGVRFILPSVNTFDIFVAFTGTAVISWRGYGLTLAVLA
ncbi:uncharacterized protein PHACADRAFT_196202 [Phanerochaete carnosa HHB-10118-sp]|uniref:Uncharacterized protein n=1 Tax=Phanerochaete carnosa (strain HHB-10118-sp) TaxID=650164 RepID=K5WAY3_PHACS|nr:uncharacterized protein PHACADRAFT_196202 [Phanerochaete carnosa HHB-10118-sp]EKM56149.1 hypothetical protein PHACADRAFT_196202 [Phanerochaete carnosa HHB-10118-sp]